MKQCNAPHDDLQLVHDEQNATHRFGRRLAVVERYDGRHGANAEASNEAAGADLRDGGFRPGLNGGPDSEDKGPEDDGVLAPEAVRRKRLTERAEESPAPRMSG